jgi:tetratricopeptide (TPR) repeat protein
MEIGIGRRLAIAALSLAASSLLFHSQVASTLVTRGDDYSRLNDLERAKTMYARALWFDRASIVAADRLAFLGIRQHNRVGYELARDTSADGLRHHAEDCRLLLDRALAEEHLGSFGAALADFDRLAALEPDARTFEFAARMAMRLHDRRAAHVRFARVLALDPRFASARHGYEATQ